MVGVQYGDDPEFVLTSTDEKVLLHEMRLVAGCRVTFLDLVERFEWAKAWVIWGKSPEVRYVNGTYSLRSCVTASGDLNADQLWQRHRPALATTGALPPPSMKDTVPAALGELCASAPCPDYSLTEVFGKEASPPSLPPPRDLPPPPQPPPDRTGDGWEGSGGGWQAPAPRPRAAGQRTVRQATPPPPPVAPPPPPVARVSSSDFRVLLADVTAVPREGGDVVRVTRGSCVSVSGGFATEDGEQWLSADLRISTGSDPRSGNCRPLAVYDPSTECDDPELWSRVAGLHVPWSTTAQDEYRDKTLRGLDKLRGLYHKGRRTVAVRRLQAMVAEMCCPAVWDLLRPGRSRDRGSSGAAVFSTCTLPPVHYVGSCPCYEADGRTAGRWVVAPDWVCGDSPHRAYVELRAVPTLYIREPAPGKAPNCCVVSIDGGFPAVVTCGWVQPGEELVMHCGGRARGDACTVEGVTENGAVMRYWSGGKLCEERHIRVDWALPTNSFFRPVPLQLSPGSRVRVRRAPHPQCFELRGMEGVVAGVDRDGRYAVVQFRGMAGSSRMWVDDLVEC